MNKITSIVGLGLATAFLLGLCESETRLPLVEIDENTKKSVSDCLKNLSLI